MPRPLPIRKATDMTRYAFSPEERRWMESSCIPFAVYQFIDKKVCTLILSQGFCDLFGLDERPEAYALMDNDMYRDSHPDDVARIADAAIAFATQDAPYDVVYRTHRPGDSSYYIVHARGSHVLAQDGTRLAFVWYIDEGPYVPSDDGDDGNPWAESMSMMLKREGIIWDSCYDSLTGLPNITYFFELASALREAHEDQEANIVILFINLIGLKGLNQRQGFAGGNCLIKSVARTLAKTFGNESCGYFGQDHFAVATVMDGLDERLSSFMEECATLNDGDSLPVKVGVYEDRFGHVDISVACDRARFACNETHDAYASDITRFDEEMLERTMQTAYVMENFSKALSEGWIKVYYQDIVRSGIGDVCDREALARWIDPRHGLVQPSAFIPALESTKLAYRLDLFVLEQVLEDLGEDMACGRTPIPVSINLSRSDFDACDMVEEIRSRVDDAGIERSLISIEITESVAGQKVEYMRYQVGRFHALGFQVWMDDFGTGYSSLDTLETFDFDLVKFDMQFVQHVEDSKKSRIIMRDMMRMIQHLGIAILAEGVETSWQVRFLEENGCGKQQGFYYSRPIPKGRRIPSGEKQGPDSPDEDRPSG